MILRSQAEILQAFSDGDIVFQTDNVVISPEEKANNRIPTDISRYSKETQKETMRRFYYVQSAYLELGPKVTQVGLEKVIDKAALELEDSSPPSISSVRRWWIRWLSAEQSLSSLVSKSTHRNENKTGYSFKGPIKDLAYEIIEEIYLTPEGNSISDAYSKFKHELVVLNQARSKPLKIPSKASFYRLVKSLDQYEVMKARKGKRTAEREFRAVGKGLNVRHILERVEVDHTPLDLLVYDEDTGLPIGRPTLTFLNDYYSRVPLGFEIGFEGTSELAVMRALRHAILPKTYMEKDYPDINQEWYPFGIPHTLICDNGMEFHANELRRMCSELNIELIFCPKHQPQYKGAIERFLGTINRQVSHRIKGTTFSNISQRGEYDSIAQTCITLDELKEVVHLWLNEVYIHAQHKGLSGKTPLSVWNKGRQLIEPMLPESKDQLNLILTREETRKLNHQGIQFLGLFYNSEELSVLRRRSIKTVTFRVDPENLGSVMVYDQTQGDYFKVPCTYPDYAEGLRLRQHKKIREIEGMQASTTYDEQKHLQGKENLRLWIEKFNHSRKIKDRQKAARVKTEQKLMENTETLLDPAFSSNDLPKKENIWSGNIEEFDMPIFEVETRT